MLPFGLSNILATFQGYINKILAEKLDIFIIVYLDDIFIYTESEGGKKIRGSRLMGVRAATKAFVICQPQKVSIPSEKDEVSRLYCLLSRYSNRRKMNQSYT